ncbi:MAG: O-antigen polymerase [Eubacteriales bacterium]|nr:O-antigen polymerase [Eubacteriales bacterium]
MKNNNTLRIQYLSYCAAYVLSMLLSRSGLHILSGVILLIEAVLIYLILFWKEQNLVNMKGFFTLSWVGGQGVACFQLSHLQKDWSNVTWFCFWLIYMGFSIGYDLFEKKKYVPEEGQIPFKKDETTARRLLICIVGLAVASAACFTLEAVVVGFIPFFSDLPHAYSYFHISGVHYFTVSCILIPAISVLYLKLTKEKKVVKMLILGVCNVEAVLIPILCVSRFQLLFAVGFAVVTYIIVNKKIKLRTLIGLMCVMIPAYVVLTVARNHDVEYLNGIFEMKNSSIPIFITQPYIYVANNFENFNCMVEQLTSHTWGLRMLFPVFALTGLKFVFPSLVAYPNFITKTELTTLTMFYDSYYDFGVPGVFAFACLIGTFASAVNQRVKKDQNPIIYLLYGQVAIYLGLSFFTTWFSNATTWFWFAMTFIMYLFVGCRKREKNE